MHSIAGHFRMALRLLRRRQGLTAGRTLTVTLVVTAVTSVFSVANATFVRPLPLPDADRLVQIYLQPPGTTEFKDANPLHPLTFLRFREHQRSFERFEGIWADERGVAGDGDPESVRAGRVSAGFFTMMGGGPLVGRVFTEAEVEANARLVVLSYGLWMRRFGGDVTALGRTLLVDREPYTIIGVANARFDPGSTPTEFWTPLALRNRLEPLSLTAIRSIGVLRPGVTSAQAVAELTSVLDRAREEAPAMLNGWTVGVVDLRQALFGSERPAILILLAAVIALTLIAVANLTNLTLADIMFRRGDFAVRAALGGSRAALVLPEVAQGVIVAAAGGIAGLVGSAWLVPALLALDPSTALGVREVSADWRVVACGLGVAVFVMMAAVVVPVIRLTGPRFAIDVSAGSRRSIGSRAARRARLTLVAAQTALALVVLSSGALVVTTLQRTARIDPGFDPVNVVTAQLRLPEAVFPAVLDRAQFVDRVLDRLKSTAGIVNAGTTLNPFDVGSSFQTLVQVEDRPTADGQPYTVQYRRVTPGYFDTMKIARLRGRDFDRRDWIDQPLVAIVSRSFARRFWPDQDPIGRRIKRGATAQGWSVVVGVVDDVRDVGIGQPPIDTVYSSYYQGSSAAAPVGLVVRTAGDPAASIAAIRRAVWDIDSRQPLAHVVTLERFLDASLGPQRFRATLVAVCGLLGLILATVGTYGVTARSVVERRKEVGIRLALGGTRLGVWWTVARASLEAVMAGVAAGGMAAALADTALAAMLPELRGTNWIFGVVAGGVLFAVAAAAAMTAARGATSVEPVRALAGE